VGSEEAPAHVLHASSPSFRCAPVNVIETPLFGAPRSLGAGPPQVCSSTTTQIIESKSKKPISVIPPDDDECMYSMYCTLVLRQRMMYSLSKDDCMHGRVSWCACTLAALCRVVSYVGEAMKVRPLREKELSCFAIPE